MRYALMRKMDISNGEGIGVSLFVQGCHFHCKGCFNKETWDFNGGKEWNEKIKNKFFQLINKPFITRVSFLGGEPLESQNLIDIYELIKEIKLNFPNKDIWLYTGYTWECIFPNVVTDNFDTLRIYRQKIIELCDVLVDGQYIEEQRDLTLAFRGSCNQRIIDVKKSLEQNKIILYQL